MISEKEELKKEWSAVTSFLPSLALTPRGLLYIAIGWALAALFFVWLPIVFAYAGALILWNIGRLFSGAMIRASEILQGPAKAPEPVSKEERKDGEAARTS